MRISITQYGYTHFGVLEEILIDVVHRQFWILKNFKIQNSEVREMGEHPKRRKDKYNPYTIYEKEGKYYITFKDGQGQRNCFEVGKELYDAFNNFELEDLSYLNVWDRHLEQSEVWETSLNERAVEVPETVEEIVLRNIQNEKVH